MKVKIQQFSIVASGLISLFLFQNCEPFKGTGGEISSVSDVDFYVGLQNNIFAPKCLTCHSNENPSGDVNFSTYASLMASNVVSAGMAPNSLLYTSLLTPTVDGHHNISAAELDGLVIWINNGALENEVPVVSAGNDISISLPTSTVTLEGVAQDRDGSIASYSWTRVSGPNTPTIQTANTRASIVSNLIQGIYVFQLRVTDDKGGIANDMVTVSVAEAANILPTINTGGSRAISLPVSALEITIQASDPDGTLSSYMWSQLSGPNTPTLSGGSTSTLSASNLVVGTYVFRILVTDNRGGMSFANVTLTVSPAVPENVLPIINAGGARSVTLPTNSSVITIQATDSDGTIASYGWSQVSGPNTAVLSGGTTSTLTASNLIAGTYVFRIQVTDNRSGMATANVTVTVNPAAAPTYSQVRDAIFYQCTGCHGNSGGYNMYNYQAVMTQVVPGNASASGMYQEVLNNSMPPGSPLSTANKNLIRDWINAGAINN